MKDAFCIEKEYEYTFSFNNETYIADKCSSNFYGYSICQRKDMRNND